MHFLAIFAACALSQPDPASLVHADLANQPADVRPSIRYLLLGNLTEKERAEYLPIIAGHLNGLSREVDLVQPAVVDGQAIRIVLDDYGWKRETWEALEEIDPYYHTFVETVADWPGGIWPKDGKHYGAGTFRFFKKQAALAPWAGDTKKLAEVVNWTQSKVPFVRADWFFAHTAIQDGRKVGYYEWLGVKSQKDFERLVRFDGKLAAKLEQRRVVVFSGITLQPRRIERTGTVLGGLWRTFDSANATDKHNPLRVLDNDLDFDATEQFAPLPNGMPAWYLGDSKGNVQAKAPDNVVGGDRSGGGNDTRLHANLSCIRCHLGAVKHEAAIKDFGDIKIGKLKAVDYAKLVELRRQYLRDIGPALKRDRDGYAEAIKLATGLEPQAYAVNYQKFFSRYEDARIGLQRAALELGVSEKDLLKAMDSYERANGGLDSVLTVLQGGGEIPVNQWEELFGLAQLVVRGLRP